MQIIHVVLGKANPDRMNGVNKVAFQLAKNQQELGHDVTVWGIANSLEHNFPARNFRTELFRQLPNKFSLDEKLAVAVDRLGQAAILHLHGSFIPEFYLLARQLRRRKIPYVYTPHGSLTEAAMQQGKMRKQLYFSLFEKKLVAKAKAVQLLGEQEYSYLGHLLTIEHKVLIPNGMDMGELPADIQRAPNERPVFNFCGRLDTYHKGLDLMLLGFAQFLKKGHAAQLEIIGDGNDRVELLRLADALGISGQVVFHGAKFGEEKYQLMAKGDVFMHTSRMEGFPMAVLEAAALGLPCLTSEPTNINSFVRRFDAGFALEAGQSPETICAAMELAVVDFHQNKLNEKGENARKMVQQVFDWKKVCRQLVEVYEA